MAISVIDLYKNLLPKTNCKDCEYATCFAFATSVIVEKEDLRKCPHIDNQQLETLDDLENEIRSAGYSETNTPPEDDE